MTNETKQGNRLLMGALNLNFKLIAMQSVPNTQAISIFLKILNED